MKVVQLVVVFLLMVVPVHAFLYRHIGGSSWSPTAYVVSDVALGSAQFSVHQYTVSAPQARSAKPGTPLVAKLELKKKGAENPSITDGVTFWVLAIYSDGKYDLYGSPNTDALPSNVFRYDAAIGAWTNDKFMVGGKPNTQVNYVVFIKYGEQNKVLRSALNVR